MLVLGIIVIVVWPAPGKLLGKKRLPELMQSHGHACPTPSRWHAANGVYHIKTPSAICIRSALFVWLGALWFHLTHGFWSSMQTMGWNNKVWINRWKCISNIYSTIVVGGFALVVVVFFAEIIDAALVKFIQIVNH